MMRRVLVLVAVTLSGAGWLPAADVIDPAEVAPGTAGICVTEMDGGERVEIPLTVLGTIGPTTPEGELVLVRLEAPRFVETGIIAGMSGSPVYVDGRLLGALAYGWAFSKQPIGGVTPFGRMLQLGEVSGGDARPSTASGRPELVTLAEAWRDGRLDEELLSWLAPVRRDGLASLPLPVTVGGQATPALAGWLGEAFGRLGLVGAPGGGAATGAGELRPGGMMAGILVDGDATVAVGGTVTEVRGDQVWAFGHPFLGGGSILMPLARAEVVAVLPSQLNSFKFFGVGQPVGTLRSDLSHGVWGRLGEAPPLVPVEVDAGGRIYSFRSLRHPTLLPLLVGYLAQSSHAAQGRLFGDQTVRVEVVVSYGAGLEARLEQAFAGPDAAPTAAGLAAAAVGYLEGTSFATPTIESVAVTLRAEEGLRRSLVVDAVPERTTVRPGDVLPVRVRLRPHQGAVEVRRVDVTIPREVPAGRLDLVVADGASWSAYDLRMRPHRAGSFSDELEVMKRLLSASVLVAALERPEIGVVLPGGSSPAPVGVVLGVGGALGSNMATTSHRVVGSTRLELGRPTSGAVRIRLEVDTGEDLGEGA